MSNLTVEEANRIIAEFMDCVNYKYMLATDKVPNTSILSVELMEAVRIKSSNPSVSTYYYSNSLDNLVPVWDKLDDGTYRIIEIRCNQDFIKNKHYFYFKMLDNDIGQETRGTIQEAACIATAKVIKELSRRI